MKRPLLYALFALIIGIAMAYYDLPFFCFLFLPILFLPLPFFVKSFKMTQVFFVLCIYCIGVFSTFYTFETPSSSMVYKDTVSEIEGVIQEARVTEDGGLKFKLKLTMVDKTLLSGKIEGSIAQPSTSVKAGDRVRFDGIITEPLSQRNPGGFNNVLYLKAQGIEGQVFLKNSETLVVTDTEKSFIYSIEGIHQTLAKTCDTFLQPDESSLVKGLLFGSKDVSDEVRNNFRNAGVSHVLAVSGLHVGYVYALVLFVLNLLKVKRKHRIIYLIPCLLFYIVLTGFSPTVIRAALMMSALVLGQGIGEQYDGLNGLCLAAISILLIEPAQLFMAGFQLSFCAVLGILLFNTPLLRLYEQKIRKSGMVVSSLCLTLCATIGTLPASLYHFHVINLIGLVSNLMIVPLVGILLIFSLVAVPIMTIVPVLGSVLNLPLAFLADTILSFAAFFARFDILAIQRGGLSFLEIALFLLIIFILTGYFNFKKKSARYFVMVTIPLIIVFLGVVALIPSQLTITFLDVGQGDSALIETPEGGAYLVDGGGYQSYGNYSKKERTPISEQVLLPVLYAKHITHLDGVFITHNHVDHSQGIEELLTKIKVDRVFVSTKYNNEGILNQKKIPVTVLSQGGKLVTKEGVSLSVFWPDKKVEALPEDDQNDVSMVLRMVYGECSVLLMGDSGFLVEEAIGLQIPKSDVIKIGHHGSKYASSEDFLKKVSPKVAIISVGKYNYFGHPTKEALSNIEKVGAKYYRTDENGAVELQTNGQKMKIKTYLKTDKTKDFQIEE